MTLARKNNWSAEAIGKIGETGRIGESRNLLWFFDLSAIERDVGPPELVEGARTRSVIGAFTRSTTRSTLAFSSTYTKKPSTRSSGPSASWRQRLQNYLRATDLEVGLLLHFGLEAKFYRVVELRSRKLRTSNSDTDSTDLTDLTDRSGRDDSSTSHER